MSTVASMVAQVGCPPGIEDKFFIDWMRLARVPNLKSHLFNRLISHFKESKKALSYIQKRVDDGFLKLRIPDEDHILKEVNATVNMGAEFLLSCDSRYPETLLATSDYPPVLVCKGNVDLLKEKIIAIVGSRKASINGCNFAKKLSHDISASGCTIASGLANGIDAAANGAVARSIGVSGVPINTIYPRENEHIYKTLYENGLVITEKPVYWKTLPEDFVKRNRIISGISYAVVIVEAAQKSGALTTARFAIEQGREVFAVPGSPFEARYKGTNKLIKEGAILLESATDIIDEFSLNKISNSLSDKVTEFQFIDDEELSDRDIVPYKAQLESLLSFSPTKMETIIEQTDIPLKLLNLLLVEMELEGKLNRLYGNAVSLALE